MSKILATQCNDSDVSFAMDNMSNPHCVWVDGTNVKYARFYGNEWCVVGGTAIAISSSNTIFVSKNCIGFDNNGNPFFAVLDGQDLVVASWNGITWTKETVWQGANGQNPLAWGVVWAGFPVVIVITRSSGNKRVWAIDKSTGSWSIPDDESIPVQDNEIVELKVARVASWIYVFWNGKTEKTQETWIGHAVWDVRSKIWVYRPSKKIEMSIAKGDIGGLDFVVWDELLSSSSDSS